MKLLSCMTLFSSAKNAHPVFTEVAEKFFVGAKYEKTLRIINAAGSCHIYKKALAFTRA